MTIRRMASGFERLGPHDGPTREHQNRPQTSRRVALWLISCGMFGLWICARGSSGWAAEPRPAGEFPAESLKVNGTERKFRLVVPKSVDRSRPAPVVIAFHGIGIDSKDLMPIYSRLNETAAKHQFLLVYPGAEDRVWGIAPEKVRDDLAFVDAILAEISDRYRVDARRIFAVGMSNGGYFAHIVGRERSKVIAAVASHSGALGLETLAGIHSERKFPVLIIHGENDRIFPIEIARENRDKYQRGGYPVTLVEAPDTGHLWAHSIDVNEKIWKFFVDHPLPPR